MPPQRPQRPQRPSSHRPGLERGSIIDIDVTDMALDGDPLGRVGDRVVFVQGAIPGERVRARVVSTNRKCTWAHTTQILRPSPHRVTPRCKHFGPCGGCAWQHLAYPEQLRLKQRMLVSLLQTALPDVAASVRETIGLAGSGDKRDPAAPWGFRSKAHFVLGPENAGASLVMGHYARGSHEVIVAEECPVHPEIANKSAFRLRDALLRYNVAGTDEDTLRGVARHVVVRAAEKSGHSQVTLVVTRDDVRKLKGALREVASGGAAPTGLHLNVHDKPGPFLFGRETTRLHGDSRLCDEVGGSKFLMSPQSFFQTCSRAAENLLAVVLEYVPAADRASVLDLYAGAGLFSIPLARRGHAVVAVEENPVAIADGIASARLNGLATGACEFARARVEDWLRDNAGKPVGLGRFAAVVLDPPREGCPPEVLRQVFSLLAPARVVYVSCNPRALATDLGLAMKSGYKVRQIQPVDMFPHTPHIEAVALLERS